jgi:O-antigen/teichoic acid export membrane protein
MTARVLRGTSYGTAGQFAVLASAFIATPLLVRMLGAERYGVLALVSLLVGYFLFTDLGMGAASTRFGAEALGQQDRRKEVAVVWTSLLVACIPALLGAATLIASGRFAVVNLLHLSPAVQDEAIAALRWAAAVFFLRTLSGILNTPQLAHMRLGTYTLINSGSLVAQTLLVPIVVKLGWGVPGAVKVMAAVNVVALLAHILVDLRILPELRKPVFDATLLRPMFLYGGGVVANAIAELLFAHFDKLTVSHYVSVKDFAYYSIAAAVAGLIVPIPLAMFQALLPAFSRMHAAGDSMGLELLLQRATKAVLLLAMPLLVLIVVGTHPFLNVWAGSEFALHGSRTAYILAAGQVVAIFGYAPGAVLYAKARTGSMAALRWIELPIFMVAVVLVTQRFGALGAAACWSTRYLVDTIAMSTMALRTMRPRSLYFHGLESWRILLLAAIMCAPIMAKILHADLVTQLIVVAGTLVVYVAVAWRYVVRHDERQWMSGMWRFKIKSA